MQVTICGPNLRDQRRGDFHVHAAGCADLVRGASAEPEYRNGWTIDADSRLKVANEVYADIIDENGEDDGSSYLETMHFFPCCAELPVRPPAAVGELALRLAAEPDTVELLDAITGRVRALRPAQARELGRLLTLFAEKAEVLHDRGPDAAVGEREATL